MISSWIDRETSTKAGSILYSLKQGETLLSILAKGFSLSMQLNRLLPKRYMDLLISMELNDNVISAIGSLRTNSAEEFKTILYTNVKKNVNHWELQFQYLG